MAGTRIASVSGIRGIVGDGLDPAIVIEFVAAYAAGCGSGPIVVGHDGRASASVFIPAVLAGLTATGRDALLAGASATPTIGLLVRELRAAVDDLRNGRLDAVPAQGARRVLRRGLHAAGLPGV